MKAIDNEEIRKNIKHYERSLPDSQRNPRVKKDLERLIEHAAQPLPKDKASRAVKPNRQELEKLAQQISEGQAKTHPAEKRVKINISFEEAIKRMVQTPPLK